MLVKVEDRSKIKKVHFKFPYLFGEQAEEKVKQLYSDLIETEKQLDDARQLVRTLESELKEKQNAFIELQSVMTLEFESKEVEHVDRTTTNMAVINPTDASNRNYIPH